MAKKKPREQEEAASIHWLGGSFEEAMRRAQASPSYRRRQKAEEIAAHVDAGRVPYWKDLSEEGRAACTTAHGEFDNLLWRFHMAMWPLDGELIRQIAPLMMAVIEASTDNCFREIKDPCAPLTEDELWYIGKGMAIPRPARRKKVS
jgi:hypothetical protein